MSDILGRADLTRPPGVIDTLTAGYQIINRRPWLLLFPIVLDLVFWLGPKLSLVRLAGYLPFGLLSSDELTSFTDGLARFNLLFLLALYVPTVLGKAYLPAAAAAVAGTPEGTSFAPRLVYQVLPESFALAVAVLLPLGLVLGALYLGGIGQLVRADQAAGSVRERMLAWLRVARRCCWRIAALNAVGLLAAAVLVTPWALAIALAAASSPVLAGFLLLLFQVALVWVAFYLFFALDAVVVSEANPLQAVRSSIQVVRTSFWSAVAFIGLILVIGTGLPLVWRMVSGQVVGLAASIVANAYIGTGLAAGSMLYYRDRLQHVQGQSIGNDGSSSNI
ncbi:MAG: hypothetical protein ACRDI2_25560 [Chloroflexota bacterium]